MNNNLKGSYKIKVYENASNTILFVTLSCKNIEYLIVSKLVHNSLCIDLNETESNSTDMKEYSFNIESFVARSKLRSKRNAITLKLISHFNTAQIEIVISPGDITYGLTYREERIMNISPDLLYIYAAFYIYMLNKLGDKLSTELKKQCNALIKLLGELDDTWKIKGKKNEKKKERLR